jgi:hypothetical protein
MNLKIDSAHISIDRAIAFLLHGQNLSAGEKSMCSSAMNADI